VSRRVLVTGATGFIGGHVARRLVSDGWDVRAFVRLSADRSGLEGVEFALGDLTDAETLVRAVDGCDAVVHCGALVTDWATTAEIRAVNVGGTRDLVGAAVAAGVGRFVHLSTTDVYGYPGGRGVTEEQRPRHFANWYAQTKLEAEHLVRDKRSLPSVVLRPATVYGPGSIEVVGQIAAAVRGGHMVLVDHGKAIAGLVYVDNVVDLVALALTHEAAPGQVFNATDGLDVTWQRFVNDLAEGVGGKPARWSLPTPVAGALGRGLEHGYRGLRRATGLTLPPLISRQAVHVLAVDQHFSNAKARELLGWTPRVDYAEGLARTLDWLRR
jgi:nucleoside-diphosphate-sugar epimerase